MSLDEWVTSEVALINAFAEDYRKRRGASPEVARDMPLARPSVVWQQEFTRWFSEPEPVESGNNS